MEKFEPSALAESNFENSCVEARNASGDHYSRNTMKAARSGLDIDTCHRLPTACPSPLSETVSSSFGCRHLRNSWQQAETSTILDRFLSAPKKTFLLRCHFHGIILLQSASPETRRQELFSAKQSNRGVRVMFWMNRLTGIFTWLRQFWLLISEFASFMAATFISALQTERLGRCREQCL